MTAPLVILDTETTGLDRWNDDVWEFAAKRIDPDGTTRTWEVFVQHDLTKATQLPDSFRADHDTRYDPSTALTKNHFAALLLGEVFAVPAGTPYDQWCHVAGAVPDFDINHLERIIRHSLMATGPVWHHHLIDAETWALGWLRGQRAALTAHGLVPADSPAFPGPPFSSDDLSRAVGVNPSQFARHTAMGDVLWAEAILRATGGLA